MTYEYDLGTCLGCIFCGETFARVGSYTQVLSNVFYNEDLD